MLSIWTWPRQETVFRLRERQTDVNNAVMKDSVWTPPKGAGQSHTAVSQSAAVGNKPSRLMINQTSVLRASSSQILCAPTHTHTHTIQSS